MKIKTEKRHGNMVKWDNQKCRTARENSWDYFIILNIKSYSNCSYHKINKGKRPPKIEKGIQGKTNRGTIWEKHTATFIKTRNSFSPKEAWQRVNNRCHFSSNRCRGVNKRWRRQVVAGGLTSDGVKVGEGGNGATSSGRIKAGEVFAQA
ncbi:hypothetical protein U1Q18_024703 [Sarracenia purpurea var. burkii]